MTVEEIQLEKEKAFLDVIDEARSDGTKLAISTVERGVIVGVPHNPDEFDADPKRFGYVVMTGKHAADIVFLDEITSVEEVAT
jgi:hypothetical protein